ncbi:MAG: twin-arginine translocase TatA/TatE family subunit [Alphaproteobacteria bacterium]
MLSLPQILLVLLVIVLLFGRGKISEVMGDVAKGIRSFKKGISEDDESAAEANSSPKVIEADKEKPVSDVNREQHKVS